MNNLLKNTAKFAVGTCFTLGATADENVMFADAENTSTEEVETSPADFEN